MRPLALQDLFGRPAPRIHCLGVGGMGVAPLAIYMARSGWRVSGEDDALGGEVARLLSAAGVIVEPPARGMRSGRAIVGNRRRPSRFTAASARGIPTVRRGELLAEVLRDRKLIAVCGSHGKTTTTAMLVTAFRSAGFPAGYVLGGLFNDATPPAAPGSSEWVVAEVDEERRDYREVFTRSYGPHVNVDWDHPDHYESPAAMEAAFAGLCSRTRGPVLVSDTCAPSLRLAVGAVTFGRSGDFTGSVVGERNGLTVLGLGGRFRPTEVLFRAFGEFNATNATAALAAAALVGVDPARSLLATFPGVRRRQSVLLQESGLTVLDDYAHHPSEIRALLTSLRSSVRPPAGA